MLRAFINHHLTTTQPNDLGFHGFPFPSCYLALSLLLLQPLVQARAACSAQLPAAMPSPAGAVTAFAVATAAREHEMEREENGWKEMKEQTPLTTLQPRHQKSTLKRRWQDTWQ